MGFPPLKLPTGSTSTTADDEFKPIKLSSAPILSGDGPTGVVFFNDTCDPQHHKHDACLSKYSIRNTRHFTIAGLTKDGCLLFCVKCWLNGQSTTAMGAFDPSGKPVPLTPRYKDILLKYVPDPDKIIVFDGKPKSEIGLRTTTNPGAGVYADVKKETLIFKLNGTTDTSPSLAYKADMTLGKRKPAAPGGSEDIEIKGGGVNLAAKQGKWTGTTDARFAKGEKPAFQFDLARQIGRRSTLTASWLPNNRPPATMPKPDPGKFPEFKDYSNYRLTLKINF